MATIAWFSLLSLFLNGLRVPLETTDKIGDRTSPLPRPRVCLDPEGARSATGRTPEGRQTVTAQDYSTP